MTPILRKSLFIGLLAFLTSLGIMLTPLSWKVKGASATGVSIAAICLVAWLGRGHDGLAGVGARLKPDPSGLKAYARYNPED